MGSRLSRQSSLEEEGGTEEAGTGRLESGRGDFHLSSLLLHPQKLPGVLRKASPAPYVRRVGWLREIQATIREHKRDHAVHILRLLRKVNAAGGSEPGAGQDRGPGAGQGRGGGAGQATKSCARRGRCRRGRGLSSPHPSVCGREPRFRSPLPGGAGLQPPLAGSLCGSPKRRLERLREATPALAPATSPCPRPGERDLAGLLGAGREGLGGSWPTGCAARRKRSLQTSALHIHTPPTSS